jgi:hypothetical protein
LSLFLVLCLLHSFHAPRRYHTFIS